VNTYELKAALKLRYQPRTHALLWEVGNSTGASCTRHADAIWKFQSVLVELNKPDGLVLRLARTQHALVERVMSDSNSTIVYREVPGFAAYRVGNDGSLWSRWKRKRGGPGQIISDRWTKLGCWIDDNGYHTAILYAPGVKRRVFLHVIVLEVFVGPCPDGMECAHDNGVRSDCRLSNLRWDTHKNNIADKRKHGTWQQGESHGSSVLNESKVREIRRRRKLGESPSSLSREFGVKPSSIGNICAMRSWKHIA